MSPLSGLSLPDRICQTLVEETLSKLPDPGDNEDTWQSFRAEPFPHQLGFTPSLKSVTICGRQCARKTIVFLSHAPSHKHWASSVDLVRRRHTNVTCDTSVLQQYEVSK